MSRAFVKESDDDLSAGELPERPVAEHANYVTPQGLEQLQARVRELQEQHEQLAPRVAEDSIAKQKQREIESAHRQREWAESRARGANIAAGKAKSQAKKMLQRVHAGVCPHCNRTFKQLAQHMKDKHQIAARKQP